MNSLLLLLEEQDRNKAGGCSRDDPKERLSSLGYTLHVPAGERTATRYTAIADGILIAGTLEYVEEQGKAFAACGEHPLIWWCRDERQDPRACQIAAPIDGIVFASMSDKQLHWSLLIGMHHYLLRSRFRKEREQLLARIEERKWIDRAKLILADMKRISEAEAYELLRKLAMNERKRIGDVAASIVKVHQLLNQDKGDESDDRSVEGSRTGQTGSPGSNL